ncbi:unnamed protein product [Trichobilharzia regenti]|nr:unnamed protein product [Trichobilharzia regenti]
MLGVGRSSFGNVGQPATFNARPSPGVKGVYGAAEQQFQPPPQAQPQMAQLPYNRVF